MRDGVAIRFITRNSWFIGAVDISGAVSIPPSTGQLENATRLDLGQPFTDAALKQAVTNQQRLFESNGLYRNRIGTSFNEDDQYQQINIAFKIDGGPRAHFGAPLLTGDLKMDPAAGAGRHQVPALGHSHLEAGDRDARAPGPR